MTESRPVGQELTFKNIRLLKREELGRGSFGLVCKAQCDQLICAAKVIYRFLHQAVKPDLGREHRQPNHRFQSEIEFLKHVHHPNIVQFLGTCVDPDSGDLVLLMELMDESLTHFLESSPGEIPYHTQVNLSYDVAQALAFLHANGVIHRDLSSNNVLLLAGARAKVTDFGMSKFTERNATMTVSPGTPAFMPPEALNEKPIYTEKLDNFSFGVLLVQVVTKKFPEPTNRFQTRHLLDPVSKEVFEANTNIPEVERRHGHISLIQLDHPLLPLALDCLKDRDQHRPSSQELCGRLNTLKSTERYEVSSRRGQAHTIRKKLQAQDQQHQAEIEVIVSENNQLAARLEQATNEVASTKRLLKSLNEQLLDNEQITATLQQELIQQAREFTEQKELLELELYEAKYERLIVQQFLKAPTTESAQPSEGPITMSWESLPDAPTAMRAGSSAVIGDRVYIKPGGSQTIHEFNYSSKQWSKPAEHPLYGITIVNVENTLTTVGGESVSHGLLRNSLSYSNKLYSYVYGKWIEMLPRMSTKRITPGAAYTNNTLVVAGGFNHFGELSTVEILNTTSRQWSSVSSLPTGREHPSVCIHSDQIYIGFYKCSLTELVHSEPSSRVWDNDSLPIILSTDESIPVIAAIGSTLTSVNGLLIAVGGMVSKPTNNVYQYNGTINSWTLVSRMSVAHHCCLTALLPDNKLMVVGGENREASRSIEIATITQ